MTNRVYSGCGHQEVPDQYACPDPKCASQGWGRRLMEYSGPPLHPVQPMNVTAAALADIERKVNAKLAAEPPAPEVASLVFDAAGTHDGDGPEPRELAPEESADATVVGGVHAIGERRGVRRQIDRVAYRKAVAAIAADRAASLEPAGPEPVVDAGSPEEIEVEVEARAEEAFWRYDTKRAQTGAERDAFKSEIRHAMRNPVVMSPALQSYEAAARAMHAAEVAHHEATTKAKRELQASEAGQAYSAAVADINAALEAARKPYSEAWAAFNRSIIGGGVEPPKA